MTEVHTPPCEEIVLRGSAAFHVDFCFSPLAGGGIAKLRGDKIHPLAADYLLCSVYLI
jgi:hypothetical protein